jgi:hypothetical protein
MAYDFGTHTPSQDDLNNYALSQIHSDDPLDIWNGTHVKNIYVDPATVDVDHPNGIPDNHVWVLTNTQNTDPPIHEWVDNDFDSVSFFSNIFGGILQGMEDPGDGSKDGFVTAIGKYAKIIGDYVSKSFIFPVGCPYEQWPDTKTPLELGLPGDWEVWSNRAIMYGLSQAAPPSFVDYYDKDFKSIAANATPVVCYHIAGDDYRLYRFIAQSAAYTVPEEFDPVKWTYLQPGMIIERQICGNLLGDEDFVNDVSKMGYRLTDGIYAGNYITEVIVPGGKFTGIEGGNRPTFVSGGVAQGRIPDLAGNIYAALFNTAGGLFGMGVSTKTGVFDCIDTATNVAATSSLSSSANRPGGISFAARRVTTTGPDVAPTHFSKRLWRRVS